MIKSIRALGFMTAMLASGAALAQSTATYNIESYGAVANDSTSDKTAIQNAIDAAYAGGGGDVFVPAGVYMINGSLNLKSNVRLRGIGSGSILRASVGTDLIRIDRAAHAEVRNLKIDGNASGQQSPSGGSGIRLVGSSDCVIDSVEITGIGVSTTNPGGTYISIEAYESGDTQNPFSGNTLQASRNRISNSVLDDTAGIAMFGISLSTRWEGSANTARTAFNDNNIIRGNTILGFRWNSIEIAGPATTGNIIQGNIAHNHLGYSSIEADKGASYNTFTGNVVRRFQYTTCGSSGCPSAYRSQKGDATDGSYHFATGNVFTGNVAEGFGALAGGAGFLLDGARDTVISGNTLDVSSSATTPEVYGVEIVQLCGRTQITGNIIKGARYGVQNVLTSFSDTQNDITIASNTIESSYNGIGFFTSGTGGFDNVVVRDNTLRGTLANHAVLLGTKVNKSSVQGNHILAPSYGIRSAGTTNTIVGNVILGATTIGVVIDSSIGNYVFGNVVTVNGGTAFSNSSGSGTDRFNSWN